MISTRKATIDDAKALLSWKNDADTRRFSIANKGVIALKDHLEWLTAILNNPRVGLLMICEDGTPIGDLRIDLLSDGKAEVSIRLERKIRGAGIGTKIMKCVAELMAQEPPVTLVAKIVEGNVPSMRIFVKAGFNFVGYDPRQHFYILERLWKGST